MFYNFHRTNNPSFRNATISFPPSSTTIFTRLIWSQANSITPPLFLRSLRTQSFPRPDLRSVVSSFHFLFRSTTSISQHLMVHSAPRLKSRFPEM